MLHGDDVAVHVGEVARKKVRLAVDGAVRVGPREQSTTALDRAFDPLAQERVVERLVASAEDAHRDGRALRPEGTRDEVAARVGQPDLRAGREPGSGGLHVDAEDPGVPGTRAGRPTRGKGHTWHRADHGGALSHTSKSSGRVHR